MARTTKAKKSESLTIRLDPKSRFILDYLARLKGQSITTIIERAIIHAADQEQVNEPPGPHGDYHRSWRWQELWHVSEGVRALNIARQPELFPDYDEEKRLAFCRLHWPFFFTDSSCNTIRLNFVDILWPRIDELVEMHDKTKADNFFAAGDEMKEALRKAGIEPPEWPPAPPPQLDLDEEPF